MYSPYLFDFNRRSIFTFLGGKHDTKNLKMKLSIVQLVRGSSRGSYARPLGASQYKPAPKLVSALGKYTKDFANLPERYVIRKSTKLISKGEDHPASNQHLQLAGIQNVMIERPWTHDYWTKTDLSRRTHGVFVKPIKESDWMWFRGDRVEILTGDDKGKEGIINYVVQERNWVCVEGLNIEYEYVGDDKDFPGMMVIKENPLDVTKDIKLVDPTDEKACDVEWRYLEDGTRVRVSTRTGQPIPIPTESETTIDYKTKAGYAENKFKDTPAKDVEEITFVPRLATFDMDIMEKMRIEETRTPAKTYWY